MSTGLDKHRRLRRIEGIALAIAVTLLGWVGVTTAHATLVEHSARRDFDRTPAGPVPMTLAPGDVLGVVEIPRLGFSSIVVEGDSARILRSAVGHLPRTPLPWFPGNTAIAGHRDGHFRPLKDIAIGDTVRLRTHHGTFIYDVKTMRIVLPSDVSVLKPTPRRTLTLVTCYPFTYVGRADKRFVIHADMRS